MKKIIALRIENELIVELKKIALKNEMTLSQVVRKMIKECLKKKK